MYWETTQLNKQTVKDIEKCIRILENVPENRFCMDKFFKDISKNPSLDCGTSACAIGWLTTDRNIRRRGFTSWMTGIRYMTYDVIYTGFTAIEMFLNIEYHDVIKLFGASEPRTIKQEIKILQRFLKEVPHK